MMKRRPWGALLAVLVALAMTAAACGGDDDATSSADPGTDGQDAGDQQAADDGERSEGGTLVSALGSDPQHLNPGITTDLAMQVPGFTYYEALITLTKSNEVEPKLAAEWEISDDGLTYTFTLQEGVTWHDGEPFTSEDVKYSAENSLPLHPTGQNLAEQIESVETPDDRTVVFELKNPYAPFLSSLNQQIFPILPEHVFAPGGDMATNPANSTPVGTGPYAFVEHVPGQTVTVERNEDYWGEPKPALDRIVFSITPDPNTRVLALESGELDHIYYYFVDESKIPQLESNPDVMLDRGLSRPSNFLLFFNTEREPFDDPAVRQALLRGIDRTLIAQGAFGSQGQAGESSIPRAFDWATNPDVNYMEMYPYDPDAARAALEDAGVEDLEIFLPFRPDIAGASQVADIIASNLEDLGVSVDLQQQERALWVENIYQRHDFDLTIVSYATYFDPVLGIDRAYRCETNPENTFTNPSGYCNEELDALLDEAAQVADPEERGEIYAQTQEIIAEDLNAVVLAVTDSVDAIRSDRVGGLEEFFETYAWQHLYLK